MKREVAHWLEEGCVLKPAPEVDDPYRETAEEHWRAGRTDAPEWGRRLANGKLVEAERQERADREKSEVQQNRLFEI